MATPPPTDGDMDRSVPHGEETGRTPRGLASARRPTNELSGLQAALFRAIVHAKLGLDVDPNALEPVEPDEFGWRGPTATVLRSRLVQHVEVLTLVLRPLDQTAARRVETFAERWRPDGMSPAPRAAAASGWVPTGTMSPRASAAGAMTAKPCDPTATAPEVGR